MTTQNGFHSVESLELSLHHRFFSADSDAEREQAQRELEDLMKVYPSRRGNDRVVKVLGPIPVPEEKKAEEETDQPPELLKELGPLSGLPGEARFCPVVGKNPSQDNWNSDPSLWLTAEQAVKTRRLESKWTGIGLMTGSKVGSFCWLDFDGEETDPETGEVKKSASMDFEHFFLRPISDLPPCPVSISGRPGRMRMLMRVPEAWTDYFKGFSITCSESPTNAFEFLYEKAGGKLFHAVIEGQHPDGQGWYYRWQEGASPQEVAIPELPTFLIAGLVRHIQRKALKSQQAGETSSNRSNAGGPSPMDLLSPGKQRKLLNQMQKFWPFRGGEVGTGYAGHYDTITRLVLSLWRGIDDREMMADWLVGGPWDRKNDWNGSKKPADSTKRNAPVTGESLMGLVDSLVKNETQGNPVSPWGAAWKLAAANGWTAPKWALPPREIDAQSIFTESAKKVSKLRDALEQIDAIDSPTERLAAMQVLTKIVECTPKEMTELVTALTQEHSQQGFSSGTLHDMLAQATRVQPCIDGLLASGAVTMVASEGGVGKSVLIYRLAEAVATGGKFGGQLQAVKGNVLVVQKDESASNAVRKMELMGMADRVPEGAIWFEFSFNGAMYPELRRWIRERQVKLVVMDSFASLFAGAGVGMGEAEVGLHLYRLNEIASQEGCAIVMTHHLRKQDKSKSGARREINAGDMYGSVFIFNGSSDVWSVVRDVNPDGSPTAEPKFILRVMKDRSGISEGGDTYEFSGDREDLSLTLERLNGDKDEVQKLSAMQREVLEVLSGRTKETALAMVEVRSLLTGDKVKGEGEQGPPAKTVDRVVRKLFETREWGVQRCQVTQTGKGRPSYRYWIEKVG